MNPDLALFCAVIEMFTIQLTAQPAVGDMHGHHVTYLWLLIIRFWPLYFTRVISFFCL